MLRDLGAPGSISAPGELDRRLAALHARVHGQHLVIAEQARHELLVLAQHVVVEGARRQRQRLDLVNQGRNYLRVRTGGLVSTKLAREGPWQQHLAETLPLRDSTRWPPGVEFNAVSWPSRTDLRSWMARTSRKSKCSRLTDDHPACSCGAVAIRAYCRHGRRVAHGCRKVFEHVSLRANRPPHPGMVVALVDCRVRAEEVEVAASVDVPHVHALTLVQHHRHRRIVVRAVPLLPVNVLWRSARVLESMTAHADVSRAT